MLNQPLDLKSLAFDTFETVEFVCVAVLRANVGFEEREQGILVALLVYPQLCSLLVRNELGKDFAQSALGRHRVEEHRAKDLRPFCSWGELLWLAFPACDQIKDALETSNRALAVVLVLKQTDSTFCRVLGRDRHSDDPGEFVLAICTQELNRSHDLAVEKHLVNHLVEARIIVLHALVLVLQELLAVLDKAYLPEQLGDSVSALL